jgi:hypothetical protein
MAGKLEGKIALVTGGSVKCWRRIDGCTVSGLMSVTTGEEE